MSRLLLIHEAAEAEIDEAADFYDMQSPGLGREFLTEIERTIRSISEFPEAAPLVYGRVRKRTIAKFPYALVYSVRPKEIRILAVAHHKRRPFYWRGR
jgi:toxin ParE1/3/4